MILPDLAARFVRRLPPEPAHRMVVRLLSANPVSLTRKPDDPRLAVRLPRSGLGLPNPIGLAAGFDKNAEVFRPMLGFGFGWVECGTVTPRPQAGNPRPRLFRLEEDQAVINRMGFNNDGLTDFVARFAAGKGARAAGVVGANVGANKDAADRIGDYVAGLEAVWPHATYVTINISSPNTPGLRGLQDRAALEELLGRAAEVARACEVGYGPRPVFLKVAPDLDERAVADICDISLASSLLSGLIVSNTTLARPESLRSVHRAEAGGLSGAPLLEPSTRVLGMFAEKLSGRLDLVGVGGVASADDVLAKLRAGAHAVQLYSALVFHGPGLVRRIKDDLVRRLDATGARNLDELLAHKA
jgi:dihydroorotate dehydrogenase